MSDDDGWFWGVIDHATTTFGGSAVMLGVLSVYECSQKAPFWLCSVLFTMAVAHGFEFFRMFQVSAPEDDDV